MKMAWAAWTVPAGDLDARVDHHRGPDLAPAVEDIGECSSKFMPGQPAGK